MNEAVARMCSTRLALSEMLVTASRKLKRAVDLPPGAASRNAQDGLDHAKAAVAELTQRLAHHRRRVVTSTEGVCSMRSRQW
jgi:hypothetical protein